MNESAQDWIRRLDLQPHPEGGYYRRIYTDARSVGGGTGTRALASSIHYLLTRDQPLGAMHRNRSTILHYLQHGGPVEYWVLGEPSAPPQCTVLGYAEGRSAGGQSLFLEVFGGCWKASRLCAGATHALVAEVVLPGFDFADHEFMTPEQLQRDYPRYADALRPLLRHARG